MRNKSEYSSTLIEAGGVTGHEMPVAVAQAQAALELRKAARRLLAVGGTIEEGLDLVVIASREEFCCRIIFLDKARFRVDGCDYYWPELTTV